MVPPSTQGRTQSMTTQRKFKMTVLSLRGTQSNKMSKKVHLMKMNKTIANIKLQRLVKMTPYLFSKGLKH